MSLNKDLIEKCLLPALVDMAEKGELPLLITQLNYGYFEDYVKNYEERVIPEGYNSMQLAVRNQIRLQEEVQEVGFNIVTCNTCDSVLINKREDTIIDCICGKTIVLEDCTDLYYTGLEDNIEFTE